MKLKSLAAVLVSSLLLMSAGCKSFRRGAKDLTIVAGSPIIVPYGAFTDAFADTKGIQEGLGAGDAVGVFVMPFATVWRLIDHTFHAPIVHSLDLVKTPLWGVFYELPNIDDPSKVDLEPLHIYDTGWDWLEGRSGKDKSAEGPAAAGGGK